MSPSLVPWSHLDEALAADGAHDAVVLVFSEVSAVPDPLVGVVQARVAVDKRASAEVTVGPAPGLPGRRLVMAPFGALSGDFDDVRSIGEAAAAGVARARDAGATRPLMVLVGAAAWPSSEAVALLGALGALWAPLEAREALGDADVEPVQALGFVVPQGGPSLARWVAAVEEGRRLARDLGGSDPERMAPPRMADLCVERLGPAGVGVEIVSDPAVLTAEYPLLAAVGRAAQGVPRHQARVIRLSWRPEGQVTHTLLFAGKGLSYDTGGLDLKVGGHMAGMSRDKCGAGAVAGFVLAAARLGVPGLAIEAEIGAVRNSIGADAFATDEIIRSHAGVRVRIGNTDAEGRLVLADLLSHLRERAKGSVHPRIFSIATLTGHAARAVGPYTIALDNGPAEQLGIAADLERIGDQWGDPFVVSRLRREDFTFVAPRTRADDVLSCNNAPSSVTARGHQFPMAFLVIASGLSAHGKGSAAPLPFTHIDIAGSGVVGGDWQHGAPTAAPVVALAGRWLVAG